MDGSGSSGAGGSPAAPALYRVLKAVLRPVVDVLLSPTVEGLHHVPEHGPAIICANHLSNLDPVLVPVVVPRPIVYLGKSEYFRGPLRWLFSGVGVVPVHREGGSAGEASLAQGVRVLADGALIGVFPEGTRSPDGRLYRGRTGPVRLAARSGAPIVPVGIAGTRQALPPHGRVPRRGRVTVRIGAPMTFPGLRGEAGPNRDEDREHGRALRGATDELMRRIAGLSGQEYVDRYAPRRGTDAG